MKDIYIIVHEEEVKIEHDCDVPSAKSAYHRIEEIKQMCAYRSIDDDPTKIPDDLPPPEECRLHVCGSSLAACIPEQMEALEKAGYKPTLSRSASIF